MANRTKDPLDTYLLRVLCLLLDERNVSRTAILMHQSQPAISAALKKLREIFDDALLVRDKGGMVPTERALELLPHARRALAEIDRLTESPAEFEPASSRQQFRIGAPDYLAPIFMSTAVRMLRDQAPQARLSVHALGPDYDFESALAEGELDIVIGNWPEPPERMHLSMLLEDEIVCLMAETHPLAAEPSLDQEAYLAAGHVVPMPYSRSQRGVIDRYLTSLRLERHEVIEVQSFTLAPYLIQESDLVFTTSRHFADFYARLLPLTIRPCPIGFPPMRFYQLWHDRQHHAPAHRWIRGLLTQAGREVQAISHQK
ncbi:LysR family transcriptional regulator [Halomonas salifodinae]|uniref:LysR family transcriptional regulator n=1 Tax=Halomonas salifodinae TaxID=438745 RepID=UPI0033B34C85